MVVSPLNPYEAPAVHPSTDFPADDDRVVTASFAVGEDLVYRAVRFDVERRTWFRRVLFWLSFLTLGMLFVGTVSRFPFWFALSAVGMFLLLHALQILVPDLWTRRILRRDPTARIPCGQYELRLSESQLTWTVDGRSQARAICEITDAYYLGDMLLICPGPGEMIPLPRSADFDGDTFASFCRLFALRLRGLEE